MKDFKLIVKKIIILIMLNNLKSLFFQLMMMINENARTKAILSNLKEFIKHVKKEELRKKNEKKTANAIIISSRDERDE
jgi:hypothetical protein